MRIVLIEPEIPQNTGSIARTCAATTTPLHLVGKLGFNLSEKQVRRAGLDYWPYVTVEHHPNWENFLTTYRPPTIWAASKFGQKLYYEASFQQDDALVFGSETRGLGEKFLSQFPEEQILRIPIACPGVRSLNLSNAVSVILYEARRQLRLDE